jgi:hypothetical protein
VVRICAFCSGEYENDDDPDFCSSGCSEAFYRAANEATMGYVTVMKQPPEEVREDGP